MAQGIIKKTTLIIGGVIAVVIGLFYILYTDLMFNNSASWLFLSIFTAFGSGLSALLSESLRNKPTIYYILKGLGIVFLVLFIVIVLKYVTSVDVVEVVKIKGSSGATSISVQKGLNMIGTISLVGGIVGIVAQIANTALNAIFGIDD